MLHIRVLKVFCLEHMIQRYFSSCVHQIEKIARFHQINIRQKTFKPMIDDKNLFPLE